VGAIEPLHIYCPCWESLSLLLSFIRIFVVLSYEHNTLSLRTHTHTHTHTPTHIYSSSVIPLRCRCWEHFLWLLGSSVVFNFVLFIEGASGDSIGWGTVPQHKRFRVGFLLSDLFLLPSFSSPGVYSDPNRNKYQGIFLVIKCGRRVELTTVSSCLCRMSK
jgi:hypothetical protein